MTRIIEECDLPLFRKVAPAVQTSITSMQAADAMTPERLSQLQAAVFQFIRSRGQHGATDEEIAVGLGLNPSTARPRRIELHRRGLIERSEVRKTRSGRNADAWRQTGGAPHARVEN